jgi:NADH pyrophosphatase NudC (nudix superfamily)
MKGNPSKHKTGKTRGVKIIAVLDIITTCPKCGGELGIWSEEKETICIFCHYRIFDREGTIH